MTEAASPSVSLLSAADITGETARRKVCLLLPAGLPYSETAKFNRALSLALFDLAVRDPGLNGCILSHGKPGMELHIENNEQIRHRILSRSKSRFLVRSWLEAKGADVVITASFRTGPAGWAMKSRNPALRLFIIGLGAKESQPLPPAVRLATATANRILFVHEQTADLVCVHHPAIRKKSFLFPYTVDPSLEQAAGNRQDRPGYLPAGRIILTTTRPSGREKPDGALTVLRALPEIRKTIPDAQLVVIGEKTSSLARLATELSIQDSVHFPGIPPLNDMPALYANSSLFALPCEGAGGSISFLEAMCFGVPCLGARGSCHQEVIGSTGKLAVPNNPDATAEEAIGILHSPAAAATVRSQVAPFRFDRFRQRLRSLIYQSPLTR